MTKVPSISSINCFWLRAAHLGGCNSATVKSFTSAHWTTTSGCVASPKQGRRFAVIGGGFIGSEVAAALAMNGKEVVMIFPGKAIGSHIFPPDLAKSVNDYYREKGVEVLAETIVAGLDTRQGKTVLKLRSPQTKSEREIEADGVVAGIGVEPNVELAQAAGLEVENGIRVDASLRTSQEGIYAAGDVASFHNPALDKWLRVEHEDNANTMGRLAGRAMAGEAVSYDHLPSFYSDLFELGYEAVGEVDSRLETVADWKATLSRRSCLLFARRSRARSTAVECLGSGGRRAAVDRGSGPIQGRGPQGTAACLEFFHEGLTLERKYIFPETRRTLPIGPNGLDAASPRDKSSRPVGRGHLPPCSCGRRRTGRGRRDSNSSRQIHHGFASQSLVSSVDSKIKQHVTSLLNHMLGLQVDLSGFYRFASRQAKLGPLARRFRGMRPPRFPSVFEAFVNATACQQMSLTVGILLLNRLAETCGLPLEENGAVAHAFPRPQDLAHRDPDSLRLLGFSRQKVRAMIESARAIDDGKLDLESLAEV